MDFLYKAFLSYSHGADGKLAPALQKAVQRIAKPWYRRPTIKIFRDATSLPANAGLWPEIERSLARCEYLVLMASVQAANSTWVRKESEWWLARRGIGTLLIVVTDGEIAWDVGSHDFDWSKTTCLPLELKGRFREEPLYVDLRWAKGHDDLSLRHSRFRSAVLTLAAPLYERPMDELDSEDIRQHRHFKIAVALTLALVNVLVVASVYGLWSARQQAANAESNRRDAESRRLASASVRALDEKEGIDRAILLGVMAWRLAPTQEAEAALQKIQKVSSAVARIIGQHTGGVSHLAFNADSSLMATGADDGSILLWNTRSWTPVGKPLAGEIRSLREMIFDATGSHLLVCSRNGRMTLWDIRAGTPHNIPPFEGAPQNLTSVALNLEGRLVAAAGSGARLAIWDEKLKSRRNVPLRLGDQVTVLAARFQTDDRLLFLLTDQVLVSETQARAGIWEVKLDKSSLGPPLELDQIEDSGQRDWSDNTVTFNRDGSRFITQGRLSGSGSLWEVGQGMKLKRLPLPQVVPSLGSSFVWGDPIFDSSGRWLFASGGGEMVVLDQKENRVRWQASWPSGAQPSASMSPDGRWLVAIDHGKIIVWDLNRHDSSAPAQTLVASRQNRDGENGWIRLLCQKVSYPINADQLRSLVGGAYELVKSNRLDTVCGEH